MVTAKEGTGLTSSGAGVGFAGVLRLKLGRSSSWYKGYTLPDCGPSEHARYLATLPLVDSTAWTPGQWEREI